MSAEDFLREGDTCKNFESCLGRYHWERDENLRQHQALTCDGCGETVGDLVPMADTE